MNEDKGLDKKSDRVSLFVDGANFFFLQKDALGWWIDPSRLLAYAKTIGPMTEAFYYMGVDPNDAKVMSFGSALTQMGYTTLMKELRYYGEGKDSRIRTPNFQGDVVLDMMQTIDNYDIAILVSGDSDYKRVLETIKARGKRFLVFSSDRFVSRDLRKIAGMHFIDFNTIRDKVERLTERPKEKRYQPENLRDIEFLDNDENEDNVGGNR